jgi:hypothetical protein
MITRHALEQNTINAYATGQGRYDKFCEAFNVPLRDRTNPTAAVLLGFSAFLHIMPPLRDRGAGTITHKTIKAYLGHVKAACNISAAPTDAFDDPRLQRLLRAIKKLSPKSSTHARLPITVALLQDMIRLLNLENHDCQTLATALSLGVHGLLRSGEITPKDAHSSILRRCDVKIERDRTGTATAVVLHLRASKTDPFRKGIDLRIVATGTDACPVALLSKCMDQASDKNPWAPLLQLLDGSPLPYKDLSKYIKALASRLGLNPKNFAGHSLRIGGATTLALLGVPAYEIQTLGRWLSVSYQLYTRAGPGLAAKAARIFASFADAPKTGNYFGGMSTANACAITFDNIATTVTNLRTKNKK